MSEEIERTLCQLPQVHVFKIPVRKSADGHRASDWPKDPTWTGKVKIIAKGRVAAVILLDEKNQIFAICQVTDESAVERTLDSGRYYVLRITNAQGRHAFIGIAFNERNDAFDFNVALAEFKSELEREDQAAKMSEAPIGPLRDLSIKDGEKIKIKITLKKSHTADDDGATPSVSSKPKGGPLLLPPPKGGLGSVVPVVKQSKPTPVDDDSWASSDPFQTTASSSSNSTDAFHVNSNISSFGSNSDPFALAQQTDPFSLAAPIKQASSTNKTNSHNHKEVNLLDL